MKQKNSLSLVNQREALDEMDTLARELLQMSRSALPAIIQNGNEHYISDLERLNRILGKLLEEVGQRLGALIDIISRRRADLARERETWE